MHQPLGQQKYLNSSSMEFDREKRKQQSNEKQVKKKKIGLLIPKVIFTLVD